MDLLDDYKKTWTNQPETDKKLSALEIYKISQSKSTSIVKWIFIIGIAEFIFWFFLSFVATKMGALNLYEKLDLMWFLNYTTYFHYLVVALFLVLFYRNYSSISVVDSTKRLMKKILRTRQTVKWYVYYNLLSTIVMTIILNALIFKSPEAIKVFYGLDAINSIDTDQFLIIMIVSQIIVLIIMIAFLIGLYYLLYGILLKKLNRNYKELEKIEN